jgi:hypothetical protein
VSNLLTLKKDREFPEIRRDGHQIGQFAGGILLTFRDFFIAQPLVGQLKKTAVYPREVRSLGRRVNRGGFHGAARQVLRHKVGPKRRQSEPSTAHGRSWSGACRGRSRNGLPSAGAHVRIGM